MKGSKRINISFSSGKGWEVPIQPKERSVEPRMAVAHASWKQAKRRTLIGAALSLLLNRCRSAA